MRTVWRRYRGLPIWGQAVLGFLAVVLVIGLFAGDPETTVVSPAKPEVAKSEVAKPEVDKPDAAKPEVPKAEVKAQPVQKAAPVEEPAPAGDNVIVERVVDGDTFVASGVTVRLIGIDTPETKDPRKPVQCFGVEAARRLGELLPVGAEIRLIYDVERTDRYRRTLAYVHRGKTFINAVLVKEGYATVATFPPNVAHTQEFLALQREAQEAGRGLWQACTQEAPATTTKPPAPRKAKPATKPAAPGAYYANCTEARQAGAAPIQRGQPGYRPGLDRDGDGTACDK